jgi:hypothetical protein
MEFRRQTILGIVSLTGKLIYRNNTARTYRKKPAKPIPLKGLPSNEQ